MPIEVRHDTGLQSLSALATLLLAQHQQQDQQQAQQGNVQDALSQLAPILAARNASQNQTGSYTIPNGPPIDQYAQSPDQPRYVRPSLSQPADHSSSVLRGLLGDHQADERMQNQQDLAQFRAQQADQRLGERNQQQNDIEQLRSSDMLIHQAHQELPQQIVMGLQSGHMQYTPLQQKQLGDFDTWDSKVEADPSFSAAEKARAHADIAMKRRQVQLAPQMLTPDKWPVTPEQQLQQSTVMKPVQIDENTTLQLPMVPVQRAGGTKWELTPDGEAAKEVAIANLKHRHALELVHAKAASQPPKETPQEKEARDIRNAQRQTVFGNFNKSKATADKAEQDYKTANAQLASVQGRLDAVDPNGKDGLALKAERDKLQTEVDARRHAMSAAASNQAAAHDAVNQYTEQSFNALSGQQPDQQAPPSPPDQQAPQPQTAPSDAGDGAQPPPPAPPLSDHPEDGPSQWSSLAIGEVTTLPNGNTVRKTGDQSFEPVQ